MSSGGIPTPQRKRSRVTILSIALLAAALAATAWGAWVFNGLIGLRNRRRAAWGDIDAFLKRRADLIPGLVAAVRGYASHEKRTFERVTEARARAIETGGEHQRPGDRADAENALTQGLRQLFAVAEDYPDLRASENFFALQNELAETENDIASARRYYNAVVRDYNTRRETFPNMVIAGPLGFRPGEYFELADLAQRQPPSVGAESEP